jgi:hypothetical protein
VIDSGDQFFSKKRENQLHALSLHFMQHDFASLHKTHSNPCPTTPALATDLTNYLWTTEDIFHCLTVQDEAPPVLF